MDDTKKPPPSRRWANLRFAIIGKLLAAPLGRGELRIALLALVLKAWTHPVTGRPTRFAFSTLERWYYAARRRPSDPVAALRPKPRRDRGRQRVVSVRVAELVRAQYREHRSWTYLLHHDNLAALARKDATLGPLPSYSTLLRFMKAEGLLRQPRATKELTAGASKALARLEEREVRSYEAGHVHELWHTDFHVGSLKIVTEDGRWVKPLLFCVLDDHSRLACHLQWYIAPGESAHLVVHGLCQAFQKRGLPGSLLSDSGSGFIAAETEQGLIELGITHATTLTESPYQNGKQENFWDRIEGRVLAMLEGVPDLTLELLNRATQAWCELEYHRSIHSEIACTPLERYLAGPDVGRPCLSSDELRLAFMVKESRAQRKSDGTVSIEGRRFEVPSRFRHQKRVHVRYARWDLARVHVIDPQTDRVLDRLHPLDKSRNADGRPRRLPDASTPLAPATPSGDVAPLLNELLAEYSATGLPPAYLPLDAYEMPTHSDPAKTKD